MLCPWAALVVTKKHCPKMFMFISMGYTTVILIFSTSRGTNFPSLLLPVVVLYSALHCDGDTFFFCNHDFIAVNTPFIQCDCRTCKNLPLVCILQVLQAQTPMPIL